MKELVNLPEPARGDFYTAWKRTNLKHPTTGELLFPYCLKVILRDKAGGSGGYARCTVDKKRQYLHRYVCSLVHGDLDGREVRHLCGYKDCINPFHLLPGTTQENAMDKVAHGTQGARKLDREAAIEIRLRLSDGDKVSVLAAEFEVCHSTIRRIRTGKMWGDA